MASSWQRTHTCGELREAHVGQTVTLNGWVNTYRNQGKLVFIDLRDRYGITQVVFEPDRPGLVAQARQLRSEWVVALKGRVTHRLPNTENPSLATGQIEVKADELTVLNECPTPPFEVFAITKEDVRKKVDEDLAGEELRLQYRYLDLRRLELQRILALRHRMNKVIRDHLDAQGFLELETPLLGRSTPEGARDYLVPSRISPGAWYALPQSPQLYKQLLMVAGYDRYFQIARCLRDEDLRADRQPEFTQLDLEMSFVEMDDVFRVIEGLTAAIFKQCIGVDIPLPLPRLRYEDVMLRYGTDKPDLRYGLEIVELTDLQQHAQHPPIQEMLAKECRVRGFVAKGAAEKFSRKRMEELRAFAQRLAPAGIGVTTDVSKAEADKFGGFFEKFLPDEVRKTQRQRLGAEPGDLVVIAASTEEVVCQLLGTTRIRLADDLKVYDPNRPEYKIAWVYDFPSFIWDDEEKRWAANHHPFTAPMDEHLECLRRVCDADLTNPNGPLAGVKAKAYDLVINGYECGGGSIRIHNPEVQSALFRVLGMTPEQARQRFGFLLDALKYGAPPHGGIALGLDRFTMVLAGTTNIRDVIAFPKNQKARDLMTGAPAPVDPRQLRELGL
ncbi:MAG: aspartate--tRNA ligase [Gemmataceae bacterium]|nr:aspartate--tRNA ligase [Gemmataceae bacterium]